MASRWSLVSAHCAEGSQTAAVAHSFSQHAHSPFAAASPRTTLASLSVPVCGTIPPVRVHDDYSPRWIQLLSQTICMPHIISIV